MINDFINDFYKNLVSKTNLKYAGSVKKLIESDELTEDSLANLIEEVF